MTPIVTAVAAEYVRTLLSAIAFALDVARVSRLLRELDDETADRLLREVLDDPET